MNFVSILLLSLKGYEVLRSDQILFDPNNQGLEYEDYFLAYFGLDGNHSTVIQTKPIRIMNIISEIN